MNPFSKDLALFTIISPCYGDDWTHLEKNAQTLKEQDYSHFEWIVVFDGPNKGEKIMHKIKKDYPTMDISWYVIEHGGAPAARNFGATKAKGDFLCFLNSDNYLYPEALRMWANAFEDPKINRVWGHYDVIQEGGVRRPVGQVPIYPNGKVWYKAFKYTNYCDSTFPIRKSAYVPWTLGVPALQDWDWAIKQLKRDDFKGEDWKYIHHSFFAAEDAEKGGLSNYSHTHWWELTGDIRKANGIPRSTICVTSPGAPHHGFHIADKLGADYLPMPSFKEHHYKLIYLVGFYTAEDAQNPITTRVHLDTFADHDGKVIIHWIGTDILQLRRNCSFEKIKTLKEIWEEKRVVHFCEAEFTQKELAEVGIKARIVPIPTKNIYEDLPMPEEFTVGIYESKKSPMYNQEFMEEIVRNMPDVKFVFFGEDSTKGTKGDNYEHVGYINSEELVKKCSLNLRITVHDGLPLLPLEFMMAGRQVVTNVPLKGAIIVKKDRKQVIEAIRKAKRTKVDKKWQKYWRKELAFEKFNKTVRRFS